MPNTPSRSSNSRRHGHAALRRQRQHPPCARAFQPPQACRHHQPAEEPRPTRAGSARSTDADVGPRWMRRAARSRPGARLHAGQYRHPSPHMEWPARILPLQRVPAAIRCGQNAAQTHATDDAPATAPRICHPARSPVRPLPRRTAHAFICRAPGLDRGHARARLVRASVAIASPHSSPCRSRRPLQHQSIGIGQRPQADAPAALGAPQWQSACPAASRSNGTCVRGMRS